MQDQIRSLSEDVNLAVALMQKAHGILERAERTASELEKAGGLKPPPLISSVSGHILFASCDASLTATKARYAAELVQGNLAA